MRVQVTNFRRDVKNTRQGYFTLAIDGLLVKKCVAHKSAPSVNYPAGKVWFAPPAIQRPEGGYENIVCFANAMDNEEAQRLVAEQLAEYL